jgi:hypothetical protein
MIERIDEYHGPDAKPLTTNDVMALGTHSDEDGWVPDAVIVDRSDLLATTRALETAVAEIDSARFARDRYANTIGLIESAVGYSGASPVEETIERVHRLKSERDSAWARVSELETALLDACREKVVHGHTTTIWVEATMLEVPGIKELGLHADQLRSDSKTLVAELVDASERLLEHYSDGLPDHLVDEFRAALVKAKETKP